MWWMTNDAYTIHYTLYSVHLCHYIPSKAAKVIAHCNFS